MRQYENNRLFYKKGFSFENGLEEVKQSDIYKIYNKLNKDEDQVIKDNNKDLIIKTAGIKAEYGKQKLVIDMFKKLGFETFHYGREIGRAEMFKSLKAIHEEFLTDPEELIVKLKKERRKAQAIAELKPDSKTFTKHTLEFINGLTADLYGLKVVATDKHSKFYKLEGPVDKLYVRSKNNDFIPVLGDTATAEEPAEMSAVEGIEIIKQMAKNA